MAWIKATGAAAISVSVDPGASFYLISVLMHTGTTPTTSENFTVTLNSVEGPAYDTVLLKRDLSVGGVVDLEYNADVNKKYQKGDTIDIAWANTETGTYGLKVEYELVGG